jgi:chondroitin AC lyase
MKKLLPSVAALALLCAPALSFGLRPSAAAGSSNSSGIAVVRARYVASILPPESAYAYLDAEARKNAAALGADGSWPDIEYVAATRSAWRTADHLERVLSMAKAARIDRDSGHPDAALEGKTLLALKWWDDHDYRNPNWWWNEIGVPQMMGEIGNLMLDQIPQPELARMVTIMKRSDWRRVPWTGANLTWGVGIEIARGCMENDPAALDEGFSRMYQEIKIVTQPQDGIEQDYSFHQHGQQLYNGGYGLDFANDVSRFISYAWGTSFQIPGDRMTIFSAYLLDGEQWMIRGDGFDYAAVGREITRAALVPGLKDQTGGPISPVGFAYRMGHVLGLLAAEPTPRQNALAAFAARVQGEPNAATFTGNKQFWSSDYMAQRRENYFTSVKMLSSRMLNSELVNSEGKKSVHMSDGANYLYLTGNEYRNIFPVWDWTKIPGTTAIQGTLITGEKDPIHTHGTTTFDGGVSDGTYGMAAMDLHRGGLTAQKAWFFFDSSYAALGAGITLAGDTEHSVATDVNQPLLDGDVLTGEVNGPVTGTHQYDSSHRVWVEHGHVGYVFAPHSKVDLSAGPQTGAWSDIGTGSSAPVTEQVFDLWIDHGAAPQDAGYEYFVLPGATAQATARFAKHSDLNVLANTASIQAVYNRTLKLAEIAFRASGSLATPLGRVEADHSCLLLVKKTDAGWKLTASNPENQPLTLHVTVKGRQKAIELPGGNFAGSSVSVDVN